MICVLYMHTQVELDFFWGIFKLNVFEFVDIGFSMCNMGIDSEDISMLYKEYNLIAC
jgi:hypothetical protein